ncbi:MAG: selenide, water dikinase SelD [Pirellulaceae bacterium]|nr:selenide, water dikinase SelD [Pirellulaceae bacterium]
MAVKDLDKRRRVMQRSQQLGHCICDAKKPCPCDVLLKQDLCPCAGERPEATPGPLRLTALVESAGCASKIDQATLRRVLRDLPAPDDPRVLIGMPAGDDAGVFQLDEQTALVQTVDVFTPSVDDPYVFGQIAAANALSDVYAMGGQPLTALSIIGFPVRALPDEVLEQILRGGLDKMAEAGVAVIGGHSINDPQVKGGFAVTGVVDPQRVLANCGLQPGDVLALTKPLGTGILSFAAQIGRASPESTEAAARSMTALNKRASELMRQFDAHACTDVTGFGLMGHLAAMAEASRCDVELYWDDVPLLPGVLQCAADNILPGAVERNKESSGAALAASEGLEPAALDILFDAQTSGGLLIAVPASTATELVAALRTECAPQAAVIGHVIGEGTGRIFVRSDGRRELPPPRPVETAAKSERGDAALHSSGPSFDEARQMSQSCCGGDREGETRVTGAASVVGDTQQKFFDFLKSANQPAALDARTKRLIAIALSVLSRCEPCVKSHVQKALKEGLSPAEIDEAAWMAISFGGTPTMMFYQETRKSQ